MATNEENETKKNETKKNENKKKDISDEPAEPNE